MILNIYALPILVIEESHDSLQYTSFLIYFNSYSVLCPSSSVLVPCCSKWVPWASSTGITLELVTEGESQTSPYTY